MANLFGLPYFRTEIENTFLHIIYYHWPSTNVSKKQFVG